jgi:GAF domain-containing protein
VNRARREQRLIETFVVLSDTMVRDFDAVDFLTSLSERAAELLEVSAAGVILRDGPDTLRFGAASSERSRLLELFAVAVDAGPCIECVRTGSTVVSSDVRADRTRWPRFADGAQETGFSAAHAVPMCLRGDVVGVLTLLHTETHTLTDEDARLAQALADSATIGLMHERALRHAHEVTAQLQQALSSRVIIEQAKGVLAQASGTSPEDAFRVLRQYSRDRSERLSSVAAAVVAGELDWSRLGSPARR